MSSKMLGKCPVCSEDLEITRLRCPGCGTEIKGDFTPCPFCRLDADQEKLLTVFLKARGNIREVERELGISYPTVRARIDEVLKALGLETAAKRREENGEKEG